MEIALRGIGVSPGIAIGPALTFGVQSLDVPKYKVRDKEAEVKRFESAIGQVKDNLERLREQTSAQLGEQQAGIFTAHLMILEDVTFREEVLNRLEEEGYNVEFLVDEVIARYSKALESVDDPRFRERTQDLVDVGNRILAKLLNTEVESLDHLKEPCIVVAHDLAPSDTANLDLVNTLGLATDLSGPTSHTAILARALEVPAVVGLKYVGQHTLSGDMMIIDGTRGHVIIRPSEETVARFRREKEHAEQEMRDLIRTEAEQLCVTRDGHEIPTMANIELPVEVQHSLKAKAKGVGLYRTEYLFMQRRTLPTEEEQYQAYAQVAEAMKPNPVILRTLDLGGDKFASHLQLDEEINPQLGWRAIRFCLERPDIFKSQLRAMFRASVHGNVKIMFPLISGVDEFNRVLQTVREVFADLERRSVPFHKEIEIGSMIEVPSAVAVAEDLAKQCDFFSIGTNDLIQYSLAVDRVNEKIAHMYEPAHPAVLRMIYQTVRAAKGARIPCSICGEMAGDPLFTELLLGLGVDSLSMSPVAIPLVRNEIAHVRLSSARRFAKKVMAVGSIAQVKAMMYNRFKDRQTLKGYLEAIEPEEASRQHPGGPIIT